MSSEQARGQRLDRRTDIWSFGCDGKELFYAAAHQKLMAVDVKPGATFEHGPPRALFQMRLTGIAGIGSYAPAADGKRFLVRTEVEEATSSPATVVLNWTARLKR